MRVETGAFAVHWQAHGLHYGLPISAKERVESGQDCLANVSRSALHRVSAVFGRVLVLNISADPETLARRLKLRGREAGADITKRLQRAARPVPAGLNVIHLSNDGLLQDTIARATALLQTERI
jgi:ribose 1,5-bisphosphokinase